MPAAIAAAKETGDPATVAAVTREALREQRESQNIQPEQAIMFSATLDGLAFALFLLLNERYPDRFTRDGVFRSVIAAAKSPLLDKWGLAILKAAGADVPNAPPAAETTQSTAGQ